MGYAFATNGATPLNASDGVWHRAVAGMYVPPTATGLTVSLYVWQQTGGQAGNFYWAEPALLIGNQAPDSVILSKEEMQAYVALGGNRIDSAAPSRRWGTTSRAMSATTRARRPAALWGGCVLPAVAPAPGRPWGI